MSRYTDEADDVIFSEPILAQKGVRCGITFAESAEWEQKIAGEKTGKKFDACKLTIQIADDTVKTEHADAKPRLTIEDQFNVVRFPYEDKKTGDTKWLGRTKLYQLEEAFEFEPVFMAGGKVVEPFVTRSGRKVAPKIDGVKRVINPDFFNAYFEVVTTETGEEKAVPKVDNWIGKTVYADIGLEKSEQFGDRNNVLRYVKAPVV